MHVVVVVVVVVVVEVVLMAHLDRLQLEVKVLELNVFLSLVTKNTRYIKT